MPQFRKWQLWQDFAMESKVKSKTTGVKSDINKNYSYHLSCEIPKLACSLEPQILSFSLQDQLTTKRNQTSPKPLLFPSFLFHPGCCSPLAPATQDHSNDTVTLFFTQQKASERHGATRHKPQAFHNFAEWTVTESWAVTRPNSLGCDHLQKAEQYQQHPAPSELRYMPPKG